jgi:hypothetical protein
VAIMAGTYGRMKWPKSEADIDSDPSVWTQVALGDSDRAGRPGSGPNLKA